MKANLADNTAGACSTGNDNWITGNIIFDRDVFGAGDYGDYGISLRGGRLAVGTNNGAGGIGICGVTNVADGSWHHIAVTRRFSDGQLTLFVDGQIEAQDTGASGNISYQDNRPTSYPNSDPYLVIGAEKHDLDRTLYPSYSGWVDEIRLSNILRYTSNFTRPTQPFAPDANTVALYHFDEGTGDVITDTSGAAGGPSDGVRKYGGSPAGPEWSSETPFSSSLSALSAGSTAVGLARLAAPQRAYLTALSTLWPSYLVW
jgi:hypothetical protein